MQTRLDQIPTNPDDARHAERQSNGEALGAGEVLSATSMTASAASLAATSPASCSLDSDVLSFSISSAGTRLGPAQAEFLDTEAGFTIVAAVADQLLAQFRAHVSYVAKPDLLPRDAGTVTSSPPSSGKSPVLLLLLPAAFAAPISALGRVQAR
jgi:hypothetical protein